MEIQRADCRGEERGKKVKRAGMRIKGNTQDRGHGRSEEGGTGESMREVQEEGA